MKTGTQDDPEPAKGSGDPVMARPLKVLSVLSCAVLFGMMLVTVVDVAGRYLFLRPLPAAYETVSLMMPAIIFLALPLSILRRSHVTVDLLDGFASRGFARIRDVIVDLFGAIAMVLLSWRLAVRSSDQHRYEEVSDELYLTLWPFSSGMAVLCALCAIIFIVRLARGLFGTRPDQG